MAAQIEQAGNRDTMLAFLARHPGGPRQVATYDDVPLATPLGVVATLQTIDVTFCVAVTVPFPVAAVEDTSLAGAVVGFADDEPVVNEAVPERTDAPCWVPLTW